MHLEKDIFGWVKKFAKIGSDCPHQLFHEWVGVTSFSADVFLGVGAGSVPVLLSLAWGTMGAVLRPLTAPISSQWGSTSHGFTPWAKDVAAGAFLCHVPAAQDHST